MAHEARVRGRLAPAAMFPAGRPDVSAQRVTLPGGLTLRVARAGPASSPPVVLLHGWGASVYMWRDWFAPLVRAGYRVVAVDLPGHGLSDKPTDVGTYTLARQVAVLRAFYQQEGLTTARTVAQSMAGTIALALASEGEAGVVGPLVLVNPAAFGRAPLQRIARAVSPAAVDRVLGWVVPRWIIRHAHRLAYVRSSRVRSRDVDEYWAPSQDPGFARAMRRLLHEFEWRREPVDRMAARLAALPAPPLVVLGARDHLVRDARPYVEALRDAGARLEVLLVDEGGHAVNEEAPGLVIPRVLAHFGRGPATSAAPRCPAR